MRFAKYEGLGNDFIVVEAASEADVEATAARAWCDRHRGVGADGVLLIVPTAAAALARMVVLNADGSRPEMCGNGLRCVALHLARRRASEPRQAFQVETDAGLKLCEVELRDAGLEAEVRIDLGEARDDGETAHVVLGESRRWLRVSMGNPHAIWFGPRPTLAEIDTVGAALSAATPGGSNVEFAELRDDGSIDLVVWERGVGRTLACGTGAGATAYAAVRAGHAAHDEPIRVSLPGGALELCVRSEDRHVSLRGPARLVFNGELATS